ncbi:indole-3-glycerol-phosphate synthase [Methanogenium cariaci]|uniref:indole-3-glycerol-phosphate synthase n=1 Tax=Methanogenium cariaci TaxID=2197 RepID=UPI0007843A94|nr:indole-3-glycerol-phosphate synthase [Methanogenium cariaci]
MILDDIIKMTQLRIREPEERGGETASTKPEGCNFVCSGQHAVIAEIKFSSPSAGRIRERTDPGQIAVAYRKGGCAAISVLTEPAYFGGGRPEDIAAVKNAVPPLPVLRKDFIIDLRQIAETRFLGADAVLLIAGLLGERLGGEFVSAAYAAELEPLVEVHTSAEVALALASDAEMIGINNRDLCTMQLQPETTAALAQPIRDAGRIVVSMSGIGGGTGGYPAARPPVCRCLPCRDSLMSAEDPPQTVLEEFVCA